MDFAGTGGQSRSDMPERPEQSPNAGPDSVKHDSATHDSAAADWGNYWQGRANEAGAALVGVERNAELDAFWAAEFADAPHEARVVDLGCGAGTVLRAASAAGLNRLVGVDVSAEAIAALSDAVPGATGVVGSADAPPLAEGSADVLTSQFGVEYSDVMKAAGRATALLAPGGRVVWVCHHADGAIAAEVRGHAAEARTLLDSGFVPRAKAVFRAGDAEFEEAAKAFGEAQDAVLALAKAGRGMSAHLYAGTQQLWQRRKAYDAGDIDGWLDGMAGEITAYQGRMDSMLAAALDAETAEAVCQRLGKGAELATLSLGGRTAAWVIRYGG